MHGVFSSDAWPCSSTERGRHMFCSLFDAALAERGPPAVFLLIARATGGLRPTGPAMHGTSRR